MNREIAVICPNGIVKFYRTDGTRNSEHPDSFYRPEDIEKLKKDFIVKYAEDLSKK
jgi:hypothetical protein